jgi:hypothetical protein
MAPFWMRLDGLDVVRLVAALRARDDAQAFLGRKLAHLEHQARACRAYRDRLLHEHMLARLNRLAEVDGSERRGRAKQHDIHAAGDHLPVGVQPDELAVADIQLRLALVFQLLAQRVQRAFQSVFEGVAHRVEFDAGVRNDDVDCRACAAPAAADESHAQLVGALRVREQLDWQAGECAADGDARRRFQKLAPCQSHVRLLHRLRLLLCVCLPAPSVVWSA